MMNDDNNYRVRERRVSKDGKQAGFGKYGCASIILLIMIGPFLILGLSQLIDTIKVSNRHESKLAIQYLQSKYGEAFKVVRGTVNYNTPLQMITLKASSEAEPDIIFSTKAYIGGSERFYWDDLPVQRGFDRIISHYFNRDEFFYTVSSFNEDNLGSSTLAQEPKKYVDEWTGYLEMFRDKEFNVSLYTYWSSDPVVNTAKFADMNSFFQALKKYSLNDSNILLNYDFRNTSGDKGEFDRLVEYLRKEQKHMKVKNSEVVEYESCDIPITYINSKNDLEKYILDSCSYVRTNINMVKYTIENIYSIIREAL
ncbi:hypothetical protein [Paenibacillus sp. IHB B 3415]|uniref:hypothetical protein n=1 Tax=Paenibacillus sp. IHB B 3415 TaxID=867080 RepID=UPI00128E1EBD|nr:hypothetical protein [Paenibacillus sp. IHB B 3415]